MSSTQQQILFTLLIIWPISCDHTAFRDLTRLPRKTSHTKCLQHKSPSNKGRWNAKNTIKHRVHSGIFRLKEAVIPFSTAPVWRYGGSPLFHSQIDTTWTALARNNHLHQSFWLHFVIFKHTKIRAGANILPVYSGVFVESRWLRQRSWQCCASCKRSQKRRVRGSKN